MSSIHTELFRFINNLGYSFPYLDPVMYAIAEFAVYLLAAWMIALWFAAKDKLRTRLVLVGAVLAFILSEAIGKGLGLFIEHPQPFAALPNVRQLFEHEIDNAFPSDHSLLFFSIGMMLLLGSRSRIRFGYLAAALLVGFSRIWAGVHYPVDVLAAAVIGITVSALIYPFAIRSVLLERLVQRFQLLEKRRHSRKIGVKET